jgi:hypothetical protein
MMPGVTRDRGSDDPAHGRGADGKPSPTYLAKCQLALTEMVSLRVALEGCTAAALQVVAAGVAVLAGSIAYLFFGNVPPTGHLITEVALQPAGTYLIAFPVVLVLRIGDGADFAVSYSVLKINPADAAVDTLAVLDAAVERARAALHQRQDRLRLSVYFPVMWVVVWIAAISLASRFAPNLTTYFHLLPWVR